MADITNLSNFLGDVADAIRTKKETTEQIPAKNFDQEILSIKTGEDVIEKLYLKNTFTTDTFTSADTFVQAENSTGHLSPVYITDANNNFIGIISYRSGGSYSTIPRVYAYNNETGKFSTTYTNLTVSTVDKNYSNNNVLEFAVASSVWNGKYCYVLLTNKAKIYYVLKLIKNSSGKLVIDTSEWWKYTLPDSMFGKTGVYFGYGRPMFSINNEKRITSIVSFGGGSIDVNQRALVSITLTNNINEEYGYKEMSVNYTAITNYGSSDTLMPTLLNNDKVCVISMGYTGSTTRKSQIIIFDDNFTPIKCNEYSYKILAVNNDCTKMIAGTSLYSLNINYSTGDITTSVIASISGFNNLDIVRQSFDGSKYYTYSKGSSKKAYSYSIDWNTGSMTLLNTYNGNYIRTCGTIPGNYGMVIVDSKGNNTLAYFDIHFDMGIQYIIYKDNKYYDVSDGDVTTNDVIEDKIAYNADGKIIGSMSNNGNLNYTSSTEEQVIPEGYTSGGTIAAYPVTEEEYNTCLNLTNQIIGGN